MSSGTTDTTQAPRKNWREVTLERMEKLADDPRLGWAEKRAFETAMAGLESILRKERGTLAEPEPPRW